MQTMKALLNKLNVETFVLDLERSEQAPQVSSATMRIIDDHTIEVDVAKSAGLNSVFAELSAQNLKVLSMRNKANRLEELFVNLVEQGREEKESV